MKKRISDKIREVEKYLEEFEGILPKSLEEYKSSLEKKAACERDIEKIAEGIADIAFLTIKYKKFEIPEDDKNAFEILAKHKIIMEETCKKMKNAKGMRNLIVHEYGKIDDEIVFEAMTKELVKDANKFLNEIGKIQ